MKGFVAALVFWLTCSFFAWGFTMGSFTHSFPKGDHVGISAFMAIGGPFGLIISILCGHPNHWRVKPMSTEERWQYFHKDNPELDREYFERIYN